MVRARRSGRGRRVPLLGECGWSRRLPAVPAPALVQAVALASVAGARTPAEARALLDLIPELAEPDRPRTDAWLHGLYPGPDHWNPLRPDRLGEALVTRALTTTEDHGAGQLRAVLALASDDQTARALDVLARFSDAPSIVETVAAAVTHRHGELVHRCQNQTRGTPERPGRTDLLDALARLHTLVLTDHRIADLPPATQAALSASSDTLGDLAADHGRLADAQVIFDRALRIDQRLAEAEPGNTTYRRDLSISYDKLADLAARSDDLDAAREHVDQALQIRRALRVGEEEREDVAVELAYTLYLSAAIAAAQGQSMTGERQELIAALAPFEREGRLSRRGQSLLAWARQTPS